MLLTTACATSPIREAALCDGTRQDRADHAAALLVDGGAMSKKSGAVLLTKIKAGCDE
jgi:hypothetical protein